ncbi:hypothetical protein [Erwinia sp. SLM-02]
MAIASKKISFILVFIRGFFLFTDETGVGSSAATFFRTGFNLSHFTA